MKIIVYGMPAPQGSKKFYGINKRTGHGILGESSKKVKPWRQDVKAAALAARNGAPPIDGPVCMRVVFTLPKPKSAPKTKRTYPDRKPDIDKLLRSTLDALTEAGVFTDDARVVGVVMNKSFPNEGALSLDVPGAVIYVERWENP